MRKIYTNHQIRKTTATSMHKSGYSLEQIAHVTKHKNLDSLKHYIAGPTMSEKGNYNQSLFDYGNSTPQKRPHECENAKNIKKKQVLEPRKMIKTQ